MKVAYALLLGFVSFLALGVITTLAVAEESLPLPKATTARKESENNKTQISERRKQEFRNSCIREIKYSVSLGKLEVGIITHFNTASAFEKEYSELLKELKGAGYKTKFESGILYINWE